MARRMGYALSALTAAVLAVAWVGAQAESHVRIIRLSYIDGSVQMDRATGQGLEKAILNTPVTEGVRLATGSDGLAEVEFENNSTLRLGENSEVRFSKLVVNDAGAKVNDIEVLKGTVYADTKGNKEDIYRVSAGASSFLVHRDTELRMSDDAGKTTVAVMKGEVQLESQPQEVKIKKKETLTLDPNSPVGYQIAKGVEAAPLDRWNNERSSYQTAYGYNNTGMGGPRLNGFGYSDLSYYGGWYSIPGIGYGWQPYGVSNWVGWNPYMAGAWSYCPGFGYTWASAYPWGWLPYHYGTWSYIGGGGWYWVPGSSYSNNGWYYANFQTAPVVHGPAGWRPPTTPPAVSAAATYAPTVKVGTIGNLPAFIPGGREIPNFRSVVPASVLRSNMSTANANVVPRHGTAVVAPRTAPASAVQRNNADAMESGAVRTPHANSGHVFAAPPPRVSAGPSYGAMAGGGGYSSGMSSGPGVASSSGMSASSSAASAGAGRSGSMGASHASSGAGHSNPR